MDPLSPIRDNTVYGELKLSEKLSLEIKAINIQLEISNEEN